MSNGATTDLPKKSQLEKNVEILFNKVYEAEKDLRNRANYCHEHKFSKEEEWLIMKCQIVQEIRFEVELLTSDKEYRPRFSF